MKAANGQKGAIRKISTGRKARGNGFRSRLTGAAGDFTLRNEAAQQKPRFRPELLNLLAMKNVIQPTSHTGSHEVFQEIPGFVHGILVAQ